MSENYTQAERPLRVFTALPPNTLLLAGFSGVEYISMPFHFQLELLSQDPDIDPKKILRSPMIVEMDVEGEKTRYIHGIVSRFAQLGKRDELYSYRAEIVPWLWFLGLSRESRIYQEDKTPTVTEILEDLFKRAGYSDFEFRLTRSYPKRPFCVQYRESHLAFVSRLMEEEGIFYFFEHTDQKHTLVLSDDSTNSDPVLGPAALRFTTEEHTEEYVVSEFEREHRVHPGKMTLRDYDYEKPLVQLEGGEGDADEEFYDFPGGFRDADEGDRRARLLLEAEEAERQVVRGASNSPGLIPGCHFDLEEHFQSDANDTYFLTRVQHVAHAGEFRAWEGSAGVEYRNEFRAIPTKTPFRSKRYTPKPLIHGSQSALVVGKSGEEIWVDKQARIKVHFYWDRVGRQNENSSCWIRVATPWGGKGWGAVTLPRLGNEVLVAFEEGDPDRPIAIGSAYNADQTPPFSLPGAGIQMGMKSRSSKGGGGFNEITATDTKGKELINIHAQYDMVTYVEHDMTTTVVNNVTETVTQGNRSLTVQTGTNTETIKGNHSQTVQSGDHTTNVIGKISRSATGNITEVSHGGNIQIVATAGSVQVSGLAAGVKITGIGGGGVTVTGVPNVELSGAAEVKAGAPMVAITGQASIKLECGGSSITMTPGSIEISSPMIKVSAAGIAEVKGGLVKINS